MQIFLFFYTNFFFLVLELKSIFSDPEGLLGQFVETKLDELADLRLVVRVAGLVMAVSYDAAYCAGVVAEVSCDACNR